MSIDVNATGPYFNKGEIWRDHGPVHFRPTIMSVPDDLWPGRYVLGFGWIRDVMHVNVPNYPPPTGEVNEGLSGVSWANPATGISAPHWSVVILLMGFRGLLWAKLRFSLRTVFIGITLLALVLGLLAKTLPDPPRGQWSAQLFNGD